MPEELLDSRRFNVVVMRHVLEHCLDPMTALLNAKSLLKRKGRLIIDVPNALAMGLAHCGVAWEPLDTPRHLQFFTANALQELCSRANLKVRKVYYGSYCTQFRNEWIATEQRIHDAIKKSGLKHSAMTRNSRLHAWKLLMQTALAEECLKYINVGIIADRRD
jgi:2-polyprenyl-3-methyl-5-hydroxy-6-metoxy-1,4-benzoquinol methylase